MKGLETFAIGTNKYLSKGLMVIRCLANFRLKTVNTLLNQKIILKKGNPHALLVGMQTDEATVENSMEFPQKIKYGTTF